MCPGTRNFDKGQAPRKEHRPHPERGRGRGAGEASVRRHDPRRSRRACLEDREEPVMNLPLGRGPRIPAPSKDVRSRQGKIQRRNEAMLDGDDYYPDYEGAILEEQENDEPYGDI